MKMFTVQWFALFRKHLRNTIDFVKLQWLPAYTGERRRWQSLKRDGNSENDVRVFYGFDDLPAAVRQIGGGLVKCDDLARHFPNNPTKPNILYLVNSALPRVGPGFAGLFLPDSPAFMTRFARRAGVKVVVNQDGVAYAGWYGPGWRWANYPVRRLVHAADYVFYQSRFSKMSSDRFLGERKGPSEILYNPVDTEVFTPGPPRTVKAPFTILVTGSHYRFYRVESVVKALSLVYSKGIDCRLRIAGRLRWLPSEEDCRRQVLELAAANGVLALVEYSGSYTQDEAVSLYRSADILVHAKYNDPCPRVVVEAMACGLPVVYSATGGTPELVGDDAGVGIAAPLDWEQDHPPTGSELAEAVIRITGDYGAFAVAARQRAIVHFDLKPWLTRHQEVFKALCS
jgi:glycosyltransferase involved in cell wall biosynthesis